MHYSVIIILETNSNTITNHTLYTLQYSTEPRASLAIAVLSQQTTIPALNVCVHMEKTANSELSQPLSSSQSLPHVYVLETGICAHVVTWFGNKLPSWIIYFMSHGIRSLVVLRLCALSHPLTITIATKILLDGKPVRVNKAFTSIQSSNLLFLPTCLH